MNPLADALVAPLAGREDAVLLRADGGTVSGDALHALSGQIANVLADAGVAAKVDSVVEDKKRGLVAVIEPLEGSADEAAVGGVLNSFAGPWSWKT